MSRTRKINIYKDNFKGRTRLYWRTIRRVQKILVKQDKEILDRRSIINDYNYSDYTIAVEYKRNKRV